MTFMDDEIARQPSAWRRVAATLPAHASALPQPGERVAVVGCGTSWFIAEAYAALREGAGEGETQAFAASLFPEGRSFDRLVAITRSGTTTEILRLLEVPRDCPTVAITADGSAPVTAAVDAPIVLDFADERSVVQTLFATTALALLRCSLGDGIAQTADRAETALGEELPPAWLSADQFTFLGDGWAHGIAREAALKMREAAQLWTEAYPGMEYRHGPIAIAQPGRVVWILGTPARGLVEDIGATGATVVCTGDDPVVDLVRVQRLAGRRASLAGLDVDAPRHLTRAVVLTG